MFFSKSKKPMRKGFSIIILVVEITAIIILHTFKINHQAKTEVTKPEFASGQSSSSGFPITFSNFK